MQHVIAKFIQLIDREEGKAGVGYIDRYVGLGIYLILYVCTMLVSWIETEVMDIIDFLSRVLCTYVRCMSVMMSV